ncbi:hypothetical protein Ddye_031077 [Dipteronia dyeriana]|uniref:Uncharacterized protein n=1 Tax=Dipteronia dyeriana TaxID=168575 RepID=A0AAD9WNC0_9ROSI|nr:hypothetical protein Ddye_031077 [Dipteronia dyeriana]
MHQRATKSRPMHGPKQNTTGFPQPCIILRSHRRLWNRPCTIPFAVYQFDATTFKGKKDINSFFNWYYSNYTFFAIVLLISSTLMIYVQTINWVWGFAIPTICMVSRLIRLFVVTRIYVYLRPEGSVVSSIASLNKSAIIENTKEISSADGCCKNPWRRCSVQQVEELKCLMIIVPI